MASSGSYDFSVTRDNLIDLAHQHIGAIGEGETSSTSQYTEAALLLNMIVKLREADGMPLWALKRGYLLPFTGASSINTNSHVVTFYDSTTVATAAAASATTIEVADAGTIATGDQIGVEDDLGNMNWTTVTVSGTTFTLAAGITGAASVGSSVYAYTASADRVQKPIKIVDVNILDTTSSSSHNIKIVSPQEYYMLGNRTSEGTPNQIMYDRAPSSTTALETNGTIYVYPRFANGNYVIEFTYHRPFQDFDASGDNPDFPQAFYLPLMLELAALLGPKFGVLADERKALHQEALMYREQALMTVQPDSSLFLQPDYK